MDARGSVIHGLPTAHLMQVVHAYRTLSDPEQRALYDCNKKKVSLRDLQTELSSKDLREFVDDLMQSERYACVPHSGGGAFVVLPLPQKMPHFPEGRSQGARMPSLVAGMLFPEGGDPCGPFLSHTHTHSCQLVQNPQGMMLGNAFWCRIHASAR